MKHRVSNITSGDSSSVVARRNLLPIKSDGSISVSFGERELLFTNNTPEGWVEFPYAESSDISRAKIMNFLDIHKRIAISSSDAWSLFLEFASQFVWVEAAGGVVENSRKEVLMICRNERWDLPKGHREQGEEFAVCAAREAEEETGVKISDVGECLATTLHAYNLNGEWELKLTVWYAMRGEAEELRPQHEEGIVCAEWIEQGEICEKIKTSFPTIQKVFDAFLSR